MGSPIVNCGGRSCHCAVPESKYPSAGRRSFRRSNQRVSVYRLHLAPDPRKRVFSFVYCLEAWVLGMGRQVSAPPGSRLKSDDYQRLAAERGKRVPSQVQYLHDYVKPGDLIWTRDPGGCYDLARVFPPRPPDTQDGSAWEYLDTPPGREADVVNVVRCNILPVRQPDDVPGKVIACLGPGEQFRQLLTRRRRCTLSGFGASCRAIPLNPGPRAPSLKFSAYWVMSQQRMSFSSVFSSKAGLSSRIPGNATQWRMSLSRSIAKASSGP
ncbi:MAG: hypothetical protein KatS3mg005_0545 [Bryobacteraceae bacterium]|nr:MAG: hypothetical protein KatS3mg005_0545 [Bryobacteraceae bacterium]